MSVILKLVGSDIDKNNIIKKNYTGYINIELLQKILIDWNFNNDEINQIKFIRKGSIINQEIFHVSLNIEEYIFIFSSNENIRFKLKKHFENYLNDNFQNKYIIQENEIELNDEEQENEFDFTDTKFDFTDTTNTNIQEENIQIEEIIDLEENIITEDIINNINKETIILFKDPDFKLLIDIYTRRPELFQILLQYTYSGDVEYNINKNGEYLLQFNQIKELNLNISDEKINEKLNKFGGHLNLTLRSLLCDLSNN